MDYTHKKLITQKLLIWHFQNSDIPWSIKGTFSQRPHPSTYAMKSTTATISTTTTTGPNTTTTTHMQTEASIDGPGIPVKHEVIGGVATCCYIFRIDLVHLKHTPTPRHLGDTLTIHSRQNLLMYFHIFYLWTTGTSLFTLGYAAMRFMWIINSWRHQLNR